MTTLDELERSVERLHRAVERLSGGMGKYGFANVYNDDVQLPLSERAELLATVERMRGALEQRAELLATVEKMRGALEAAQSFIADGGLAEDVVGASIYHQVTAALTTGEAPNAGVKP